MNKKNFKLYLKKINDFSNENNELKILINKKGSYKAVILMWILEEKMKIENIDSFLLLEITKYFIRLRRFIFKFTNFIEDFLTSIYVDNEINKLLKSKNEFFENNLIKTEKFILKTFGNKKEIFVKEKFYCELIQKNKFINEFKNFDDYKERLSKIIFLRNNISHFDNILINYYLSKKHSKNECNIYSKIMQNIENIKFFLLKEFDKNKLDWECFDKQFKKMEQKIIIEFKNENNKQKIIQKVKSVINMINNFDLDELI